MSRIRCCTLRIGKTKITGLWVRKSDVNCSYCKQSDVYVLFTGEKNNSSSGPYRCWGCEKTWALGNTVILPNNTEAGRGKNMAL
jgi:hypothetical protein